ncbi:MAG: SDR family NAD(P)-dependent oxidoreductase [Halobacteriales archaeon]
MAKLPEERAGVAEVDLSGATALVTGSTSGIGRVAARSIARLGADVIVHGRDASAGTTLGTELRKMGSDARFVRADFSDVDAVRALADSTRAAFDSLDILCNNAGGYFPEGRLTDIGVEYTFHVNHLAPYLLTAELLDHMAPGGRIVTTASEAHRGTRLDLDAVTSVEDYTSFGAYGRSKLANVQFAMELDRRLDRADRDLVSNALHPGGIPGSGFTRFLPGPLSKLANPLGRLPFVTSVEEGGATLARLAASEDLAGVSGAYFTKWNRGTPTETARDPDAQRALWERSAELLEMETPLADATAASAGD